MVPALQEAVDLEVVVPDQVAAVDTDLEVMVPDIIALITVDIVTGILVMLLPFTVVAVDGIGGPIPTIPGGHPSGFPAVPSPVAPPTRFVLRTLQPATVIVRKGANTPERWKQVHTLQGPHQPYAETRRCPCYTRAHHVRPYDVVAPLL